MTSRQEQEDLPKGVLQIIEDVENAEERKFYQAKTGFSRKLSDILIDHGGLSGESNLIKTNSVSVERNGATYKLWIEEQITNPPGVKTVLCVLPSDEDEPYTAFTFDGLTVKNIDDEEIEMEETNQLVSLTEALSFIDGQLSIQSKGKFIYQEALVIIPGLKDFVSEAQEDASKTGQDLTEEVLAGLFSKMDGVIRRRSWVGWLNTNVPALEGKKPRDLIATGEISRVESNIDAIAYGAFA